MIDGETKASNYLYGIWNEIENAEVALNTRDWWYSSQVILNKWPGILEGKMHQEDARYLNFNISVNLAQCHYLQWHQNAFSTLERRNLLLDLGSSLIRTLALARAAKAFSSSQGPLEEQDRLPQYVIDSIDKIFGGVSDLPDLSGPALPVNTGSLNLPSITALIHTPPTMSPRGSVAKRTKIRPSPSRPQASSSRLFIEDAERLSGSAQTKSVEGEKDVFD